MAWVERRITRTTQPQDAVKVDWENKNTTGLLGSWVGAGRGKAVFGTDAVPQGNAVAKAGRDGVGLSNTDTGSNNFWKVERGTTYTYTQQVTFEALIEVDVFTNVAPFISGVIAQYVQPGSSADDRGPFLRFGNGSSENRDKPFFAVMQNNTERGVLGPSLQTGRKYHLLGTYDGATVKLFIDGVLIGTNATTGSFENGSNAYLAIGTDYPGTSSTEFRALQGRIYLANVYGIGKTEAQAKSLAANPWQTFEPEVSRVWFDDQVSGAVTGNASGSLSAVSLSPVSGAASGTASASSSFSAISLTAINATANGSANASASPAPISLSPVTGTANGETVVAGNASGAFDDVALSPVSGTASGAASSSCALSAISLTAINGTASGEAVVAGNAAGAFDDVSLAALTGAASGGSAGIAAGVFASLSINPATGAAYGSAVAVGSLPVIALTPLTGSATGVSIIPAYASGAFDDITLSPLTGTAAVIRRIRPIVPNYNTMSVDASYNVAYIDPTYWID